MALTFTYTRPDSSERTVRPGWAVLERYRDLLRTRGQAIVSPVLLLTGQGGGPEQLQALVDACEEMIP